MVDLADTDSVDDLKRTILVLRDRLTCMRGELELRRRQFTEAYRRVLELETDIREMRARSDLDGVCGD